MLLEREINLRRKHEVLLSSYPFSDLVVFDTVLKRLPVDSNLHLANSTPIRYSQLFASRSDVQYHCNRGTSGIDGCVSTAAGYAVASPMPTILITGDISFIYDSNGMWNQYLAGNFKIVVINNGGGNIFRLINTGEDEIPAREFLETPHHVNIKFLAGAFGASHAVCQSLGELPGLLDWFLEPADHPYILEIMTDSSVNTTVFKNYYNQIKLP
jgi:2-succinyl-5-enolpyruvyl-6-hydroxy-3-cyclohexene-1-carboxylate synthase